MTAAADYSKRPPMLPKLCRSESEDLADQYARENLNAEQAAAKMRGLGYGPVSIRRVVAIMQERAEAGTIAEPPFVYFELHDVEYRARVNRYGRVHVESKYGFSLWLLTSCHFAHLHAAQLLAEAKANG